MSDAPRAPYPGIDPSTASSARVDRRTTRWLWSLSLICAANLALWGITVARMHREAGTYVGLQLLLSGVFVAVCAFRSIVPRVDLERQCLWNTPLSSIFLGRTVA